MPTGHPAGTSHAREQVLLKWTLLLVVIAWRLQDFAAIGMTNPDDLRFSTDLLRGGPFDIALQYAKEHGRIYYLVTAPINLLAATFTTSAAVQAINLCLFATVPWMVAWMAVSGDDETFLFLLAYWTLCAPGWYFTAPAAYPIVPMLPLAFAWLAAIVAARYLESPGAGGAVAVALLTLISVFQYEPGALVALALLLWSIHRRAGFAPTARKLYIAIGVAVILYAAMYFAWRTTFPTAYEGATLAREFRPLAMARVVAAYAIGALPIANVALDPLFLTIGDAMTGRERLPLTPIDLRSIARSVAWMDLVVGGAAVALLATLISSEPNGRPTLRLRAGQFAFAAVLLVLASVLLAPTSKYQEWARAWTPYLTSYYALFGWSLAAVVIARMATRPWSTFALMIAFFPLFLYAAGYNHATARQIRSNYAKWSLVDALASCRQQLPYRTFVVPAAFAGIFDRTSNWSRYWKAWSTVAFRTPLDIVPAAPAIEPEAEVAHVAPELDDTGFLTAALGRSGRHAFVISAGKTPDYLRLKLGDGREVVVMDRDAKTVRCTAGFRMRTFLAEARIGAIDAGTHRTAIAVTTREDSALFIVPDADVEGAVEALYLLYSQKPADPTGLRFWATRVRDAGGTIRDVADEIAGHAPDDPDRMPSAYETRVVESYRRLAGRDPSAEERARMDRFGSSAELSALVPWLVAADLFQSRDARFSNRIALAAHYTKTLYPKYGWRPDVWRAALAVVTESPDSLRRAMGKLEP